VADDVKIRVEIDKQTLGQTQAQIKDLRVRLKEMIPGSSEFVATNAQLQVMTSELRKVTQGGFSFREEVRGMRQEARMFRFALMELMQGAEGVAISIGAIAGVSKQTQEELKGISKELTTALNAGLGLSFAMSMLGDGAKKLAGPVGILVGGITMLGMVFADAEEKARKFNETRLKVSETLLDLQYKTGQLLAGTYRIAIIDQLNSFAQALKVVGKDIDYYNAQALGYWTTLSKLQEFDKKIADDKLKTEKEKKKLHDDELAYWDKLLQYQVKYQTIGAGEAKPGVTTVPTKGRVPMVPPLQGPDYVRAQQTLMAVVPKNYAFELEAVSSAFQNIGTMIQVNFIEKMIQSTNVFEQFTGAVLAGLEQFAAKMASMAAISGIMSLLFPGMGSFSAIFSKLTGFAGGGVIPEPVFGVGKSGRAYTFAEYGPERIMPISQVNNYMTRNDYTNVPERISPVLSGGNSDISIRVADTRIKNGDIYLSWSVARTNYRKRGGNT